MKKLVRTATMALLSFGLIAPIAHAYREQGNFFMGQSGVGRQNIKSDIITEDGTTVTSKSDGKSGAAFRIAQGRRFHRNFGAEIGITKMNKAEWKVSSTGGPSDAVSGTVDNKVMSLDINAIALLPVFMTVTLYAKLGVEGVHRKIESSLDIVEGEISEHLKGDNKSNIFRPKVAVGVTHELNDKFDIDLMASRTAGKTKNNPHSGGYLPDLDFFALGLVYNMG